jgi:outer membrane protein assembly factor BamA
MDLISRRRTALLLCGMLVMVVGALAGQVRSDRGLIVRQLSVHGNESIRDEALRISIASSRSSFFARSPFVRWIGFGQKRYLNETELQRDVLRITALYRQSGFIDATVDTAVRRTDTDVYIEITIDEGEPFRVVSFDVEGVEGLLNSRDLSRALPLQVGEPFNRLLMMASADTVRLRLADIGFAFAEVFQNFDTDREARTADIRFEVDPGPRATIGDIDVVGTEGVSDRVVRRTISLEPGDLFRQRNVYNSQLDLYRTQLFDYVSIGYDPSAEGETLDMQVRVSEGPRSRLRFGGGYGTIDCFRALGSWTRHNFLGGGRVLGLRTRLSRIGAGSPADWGFQNSVCPRLADEDPNRLKLNYNLTASFHQPYLFSRRTSATLELFAEQYSEFQAYLREAVGGDIGVTYRVKRGLPVTLGYSLSYGSTLADPAIFCTYLNVCNVEDTKIFTNPLVRATLSLSAVYERRNSALNPSQGSLLAAELRWASPAIGSDTLVQFTKGTIEYAHYLRMTRRSVLSLRVKLGTILPAELGFEGQELKYVPTEERFYAGGANTVRGYGQNELGPIVRVIDTVIVSEEHPDGQAIVRTSATGGNDLIIANAELRFPIPMFSDDFTGAAFIDAGRVFARGSEIPVLTGLRVTPGVGLRIGSPLGPIRFDVAFNPYPPDPSPLYRKENGDLILVMPEYRPDDSFWQRFRLHFSVGQAF